jgi:hypothetical protein
VTRPLRKTTICAALVLAAQAASSQPATLRTVDVSKMGPQVGQRIPDFRLNDQTGRERTRESIMGPKGAMIVFYRSADW